MNKKWLAIAVILILIVGIMALIFWPRGGSATIERTPVRAHRPKRNDFADVVVFLFPGTEAGDKQVDLGNLPELLLGHSAVGPAQEFLEWMRRELHLGLAAVVVYQAGRFGNGSRPLADAGIDEFILAVALVGKDIGGRIRVLRRDNLIGRVLRCIGRPAEGATP